MAKDEGDKNLGKSEEGIRKGAIYGDRRIQAEIGATEGEDKRKMEENMKSDDGDRGQEEGNMQQKTLAYLQNTYTYLLTLILILTHTVSCCYFPNSFMHFSQ